MEIKLDYTSMMASVIGERYGITETELEALIPRTEQIHDTLMARRDRGELPFYDLPFDTDMVEEIVPLADGLAERFENVVVLGIGGSALGTIAIANALAPLYHNQLPRERRKGRPRLYVLDNVDPSGFGEALDLLDPAATVFVVISKSGSTVETMCQFMIAREWAEKGVGALYKEHFILVTDPLTGGLRQLAETQGYRSCEIPSGVGGRFTALTAVSLLPLAAIGVDIRGVLRGAAAMSERVTRAGLMENPAYLNAALQYLAYQKGLTMSVMMPYSDRLRDIADWFRQLWAESLGKKHSLSGEIVHVGPTPIKALGTTDQHSQVQLYMEGPCDKTVTFLIPDDFGTDLTIPPMEGAPGLSYLAGRSMAELIVSEQRATSVALTKNGRSNCTISIPAVTAESIGALIYLFEVQTLFAGALFDVDPLDQPGVEEGKELTYALMGRSGFEAKKQEFDRWSAIDRRVL